MQSRTLLPSFNCFSSLPSITLTSRKGSSAPCWFWITSSPSRMKEEGRVSWSAWRQAATRGSRERRRYA